MSASPPTEAPAAFVCDCGDVIRSACDGLPFFKEQDDKQYCVLHYPGSEKSAAFSEALSKKLEADDFNFMGVWFPDAVDFTNFAFTKAATFSYATFSNGANFYYATFSEEVRFFGTEFRAVTIFTRASLAKVDFTSSVFSGEAQFISASFNAEAKFSSVTFAARAFFFGVTFWAKVDFDQAKFEEEVIFHSANFKDQVTFKRTVFGDNAKVNLEFARVEKPDRFAFYADTLRPRWFVNVDARKFDFIDVNWQRINIKKEIESTQKNEGAAHRLLSIACRNLAVNAEENHRYEEASRFRYMAMEAGRLEKWRGFVPWRLSWWYWLASGYGERVWRAFVVLAGVWLLAAALYTQLGFVPQEPRVSSEAEAVTARRDEVGQPLMWPRALTYSLGVLTLQKPEPRPATDEAQAVVLLETILGPVQAALLALAIRRKFMR